MPSDLQKIAAEFHEPAAHTRRASALHYNKIDRRIRCEYLQTTARHR